MVLQVNYHRTSKHTHFPSHETGLGLGEEVNHVKKGGNSHDTKSN